MLISTVLKYILTNGKKLILTRLHRNSSDLTKSSLPKSSSKTKVRVESVDYSSPRWLGSDLQLTKVWERLVS